MKLAIPMADGKLATHFGHCAEFALLEADEAKKTVVSKTVVEPPPHEPGLLPRWLAEKGVTVVIAGGMGMRAQQLFAEKGIRVVTGAPADDVEAIADAFLKGTLKTGENACAH
ncbi:MAG TPA: NifB/NifX family molybdenum-iron cluster-binding protein [Candidatus Brocadiia bacterium]|nr:NifB/NifX family molybdenum-iron cluster-binding protein [Candidatus Brocadiia bacterium]